MTSNSTNQKQACDNSQKSAERTKSARDARRFFLESVGTILVAEDEEAVRNVIHLGLEVQGFRVVSTNRPTDALRLFDENANSISLLLTDVVMPELTGRDLYQKLREKRPDLKVLYISGYPDDVLMMYGITRHDFSLIRKPFSPRDLAKKILEILSLG